MARPITVTVAEAMLIDWVLTMHAFDISRLEQLETPVMIALRKQIAPLIVEDKESRITFTAEELGYLLIAIPITFRFYKDDIGFSLKKKLLGMLLPPRIDWGLEVKNENGNDHPDKNDTQSQTPNSS